MLKLIARIPVQHQPAVARRLLLAAAAMLGFGVLSVMSLTDPPDQKCTGHLWMKKCVDVDRNPFPYVLACVLCVLVAALLSTVALALITSRGRLRKYPPILKGIEAMPIQRIVGITGSTHARVYRDLELLIESDMIGDFYIDYEAQQVVSKKYIPGASRKTVVECSECGGHNEVIIGITKPCSFCGQALLLTNRGDAGRGAR